MKIAGLILISELACAIGMCQALAHREVHAAGACNFQHLSGWMESNLGAVRI